MAPTLVAELKEYGCGIYGCVLPTYDNEVVLKVTTDDTEAEFASQLAATLVAPICVEYYMAVSLDGVKHEKRPVFLLWRESAEDVGKVAEVLGDAAGLLVHQQHAAAQQIFLALRTAKDAHPTSGPLMSHWVNATRQMAMEPELHALATGMLRVWNEQKIFFGDVHEGNLGRVFRGGEKGQWVITDPGNVSVVR